VAIHLGDAGAPLAITFPFTAGLVEKCVFTDAASSVIWINVLIDDAIIQNAKLSVY